MTLVELGYAASCYDATLRTSLPSGSCRAGRPGAILVDARDAVVQLPAGTTLDPGGLGKGLAADIVAEELLSAGASGALVEIGGDLRVAGEPPTGDGWTIGIRSAVDGEPHRVARLTAGGVATSSSRLRTWRHEGRAYHHLIDPDAHVDEHGRGVVHRACRHGGLGGSVHEGRIRRRSRQRTRDVRRALPGGMDHHRMRDASPQRTMEGLLPVNEHVWWYLARSSGIVALVLLVLSLVWGVLLATRALRHIIRPAWLLDLHKWLGGMALVMTGLHLLGLFLDGYIDYGFTELLVPGASAYRPLAVAIGILSFYVLVAIQATSYMRRRLSKRLSQRAIHLLSYGLVWSGRSTPVRPARQRDRATRFSRCC